MLAASATPTTTLTRIPKGTAYQIFQMNSGATIGGWVNGNQIHATASAVYNTDINKAADGSYTDVTSATVNITTSVTCDIWAFFQGHIANGTAGNATSVKGVINGTADTGSTNALPHTTQGNFVPFFYIFRRAAVAATTNMVVKLQYAGTAGTTAYFQGGYIHVLAINS